MTGQQARSQGVVDLINSLQRPNTKASRAVGLLWNRQCVHFQNIITPKHPLAVTVQSLVFGDPSFPQ